MALGIQVWSRELEKTLNKSPALNFLPGTYRLGEPPAVFVTRYEALHYLKFAQVNILILQRSPIERRASPECGPGCWRNKEALNSKPSPPLPVGAASVAGVTGAATTGVTGATGAAGATGATGAKGVTGGGTTTGPDGGTTTGPDVSRGGTTRAIPQGLRILQGRS